MISSFTTEDVEAVAVLHQVCFEQSWEAAFFSELLSQQGVFGLLVQQNIRPVGVILLRVLEGEAEILTMAVHPASRRSGVGEALLTQALTMLPKECRVMLEVDEMNTAALALYKKHGFVSFGMRPNYYVSLEKKSTAAHLLEKIT